MQTKKNKYNFLTFKNLLISILVLIPLIIIGLVGASWYWGFQDSRNEKIIDKEFHQDIKKYPTIKVKTFKLWEGDSMVTLDIPQKGEVSFWYGVDKVPRIESIGKYTTLFTCFNINKNREKVSYAYDYDLWLDSRSPYTKWFHFQVNTIGDLLHYYNDIRHVLKTFPQNPPLVDFHDGYGERKVLKNLDLNFQIKPKNNIVCDLYFSN